MTLGSPAPRAQSPLVPALRALEDATGLDALAGAGDKIAEAVTADDTVKGLLQGRWLGHALHPLLVELPIGTWMSAAALDAVGGEENRSAARLLAGLGVLAAVPTALSGWAEYAETGQREKRVGVVHAAANGAAVVLQAGSWLARTSGRHQLGRALGFAGVGLAGAAGYLGGHLAIARDVGTSDPAFADGR